MPDLANNPTKKQLDELDSLLQKMLGVPTSAPTDSTQTNRKPEPPPVAKVDSPKYSTESVSTPTAAPESWDIDLNPRGSSSVLGDRSPLRGGSPPTIESPPIEASIPPSVVLQVKPFSAPTDAPSPRRVEQVPLLMQPFAAATECFDAVVGVLGPVGTVATSSFGRTVMGFSGLALLLGSGAWFAMIWFGWSQ